ncbi:zinc-binding dehydrogenase [Simiduia agarivorans]|uniref:Zinc-containing alcohol dehydrogenase n=1 Tax=Simiduia agarivorans (strain DSM 21679 / JCM 13881 / BCRC 17597 / SA1) TaxID=1117647 RepID=K4KKK4_SIMAS|nr:zinc-binding dehydrogenase [Simiduia agarivorans]AFU99551.1 zinc-containing alcohol dehydrogenase [Simiduia agarivorans SA1 = DSM 21679]
MTRDEACTRQVWRTPKAGALSDLAMCTEPMPALAPEKIRVSVQAVGLNFADIFALTGLYSATPAGSFVPGLEFSGVVVAVGEQAATDFKPGDRIFGCIRFGAYADSVDVLPQHCRGLPDDWTYEQGAAFAVQALTAFYALTELGNIKPGQQVLVQSAAGGVGLQAMKMARAMGANPIGTVGNEHKKRFLHALGFTDVLVRGPDFGKQLQSHLGERPLHLVLDGIGGAVQKNAFDLLAPMGRLVAFGAAEFTPGNKPNWLKIAWRYLTRPRYDLLNMISENKSVLGFNLIWLWQEQALFDALLEGCVALNLSPPHVGHVFAFADAKAALDCLRSGQSVGKVVLVQSP